MLWVLRRLHLSLASMHYQGQTSLQDLLARGSWWFGRCWRNSDDDKVHALSQLGVAERPSEAIIAAIEAFVCKVYLAHTELTNVADVRLWLFKKKQVQSEGLPPTKAALLPAIMRAHYQAMIWYNDVVPNPELPRPEHYGWDLVDGKFKPVMTSLPPAALIHLVKCDCPKSQCANNFCKCRKIDLTVQNFVAVPLSQMNARTQKVWP